MALEGWDHIPRGFGAQFDLDHAPWWLRLWFHTPVIDRYAHPKVVARGYGFLIPTAHYLEAMREVPGPGWRVRPPDYVPPGADYGLRPLD